MLKAAFAAVLPALFVLALVQHIELPLLDPPGALPRWQFALWTALWLGGTLAMARWQQARSAWVASLGASALGALVAAGLAGWAQASTATALGWLVVAALLAGLARLVAGWRAKPVRRREVAAAAKPEAEAPRSDIGGLPHLAAAIVFVDGFVRAHVLGIPPGRGAGMLLMLLAFFVLLPAAVLAAWRPRAGIALWWVGTFGVASVSFAVIAPTPAGLASTVAAVALSPRFRRIWRPPAATPRAAAAQAAERHQ